MAYSPSETNELIRSRRSIYPKNYTGEPIPRSTIQDLLENANWAPTHRMTEPWRFKVVSGKARTRLGELLGNYYAANTPKEKYTDAKYLKTKNKPAQSEYVIAICMQRDPKKSVPEFEEIAATACAVQNMLLTAWGYGLGAYWSTPSVINSPDLSTFLSLGKGERCLGFMYIGNHNLPTFPGKRSPVEEKVVWLD